MHARENILEQGYTTTPFDVSHDDRRRAAELGNQMIDIALVDERFAEGLAINTTGEGPANVLTDYRVGVPKVSNDSTRWFHSGWQTVDHLDAIMPRRVWPEGAVEFFDVQRTILENIASSWVDFLGELKTDGTALLEGGVADLLRHRDAMRNNHHLRLNRYLTLDEYSGDNHTFSAHGDRSMVSGHIFETHSGHLRIAPYPIADISNDALNVFERAERARELRETQSNIVEIPVNEVALFLGFGAAFMSDPDNSPAFADLMAAYHYGEPPEVDAPGDNGVEADFGDNVRVSLVAFGYPHLDTPYSRFQPASKEACRPEQIAPRFRDAIGTS